jgi:F420-dependent oxidoreductase-like protein
MIRFGVQALQGATDYATLRDYCLRVEELGYDSVWLCDHFFPTLAERTEPMLEGWTTLTAIAALTSRIRLGHLVLCTSFRQPALLAKMAATLDVIADGRFEFGIGAGWLEDEHRAYGYDFPKASVRIERMAETVEICRRMWTEDAPSFLGKHFRIEDAVCEPKPVQKPHPPIWIGGTGEKHTVGVVARYADMWNCSSVTPDDAARKIAILDQRCAEVGRSSDAVEKTWYGMCVIADDESKVAKALAATHQALTIGGRLTGHSQTLEEFASRMIAGTPKQCIAKIEQYVAVGMTYFTMNMGSLRDLHTPTLFAEKVLPHFR